MASDQASLNMTFQVADVQKPLASVHRMVEKGNKVAFGFGPRDNFIENNKTGDKIFMRKTPSGSFVLDIDFRDGGSSNIVVDSGAEENVCPKNWGSQFGLSDPRFPLLLKGAGGEKLDHHGERRVHFTAPF